MLKRFRSKPPQSSRLLRDITTFSAATGSVHRRSHLQLSSYPPLRISYGKTNPELQLLSHCPLSDSMDSEESNPSPRNTSLSTDGMITKELHSISEMFPYLLRQAGKQPCPKDLKALAIERPCIVPPEPQPF
ncbi:hypothetical protein F2Q69_00060195 [Brassica cretica]|uniref:Uncharacterized protein n=1 Tax=Brassica cretica TaxID=69181 RepID=A0A8S9RIZ2_BRACR|nr:hypothetical protein F2Q69_00060195 [Brassica cretica]